MNFDYSADAKALREQAAELFASSVPSTRLHQLVDSGRTMDAALWTAMASLGWTAPQVEEGLGGVGADPEMICALAEAAGMALAPVPFMSSAVLMTEAVRLAGTASQRQTWLPGLAAGRTVGTAALWDQDGGVNAAFASARVAGGKLSARKSVVPDGMVAQLCVASALDVHGRPGLYVVELDGAGVTREPLPTLDLLRGHALIEFDAASAERLGDAGESAQAARGVIDTWFDRAAVYTAFEQLGGAQACLDMAVRYAQERMAFGRLIGSFQGIKHKLADMYVAIQLARSNCYFAAAELQGHSPGLRLAAAAARQAASAAYELAAKENIQTHGGFGFTWEADCHLHYRRGKALSVALGAPARWRDRLVDAMAAAH